MENFLLIRQRSFTPRNKHEICFFWDAAVCRDRFGGLIADGFVPAAIVCNPDRPLGRKKIITPPPTKQLILDKKLSTLVLQPEKLDDEFIERSLRALQPDFFVVAAYAKIIPHAVLSVPRLGTLGTHPSLLPAYRGASPIQSVILAGETKTGSLSIHG